MGGETETGRAQCSEMMTVIFSEEILSQSLSCNMVKEGTQSEVDPLHPCAHAQIVTSTHRHACMVFKTRNNPKTELQEMNG